MAWQSGDGALANLALDRALADDDEEDEFEDDDEEYDEEEEYELLDGPCPGI